jgi:hypothetical protein
LPAPAPNEQQANPDKKASTTTATPPSNGSQDYFPWGPTPFNWENGQIDLKWTETIEDSGATVEGSSIAQGGSKFVAGPYAWSGQGVGFRTLPAGTVAKQEKIARYPTPFAFVQYFGFYVLRNHPITLADGSPFVRTEEVVVVQIPINVGTNVGFNTSIFPPFIEYFSQTITHTIEIIELKFNGVPQTPPKFAQFTNNPIYE